VNIRRGHWLPAFGVAALLHFGLAAAVFWEWSDPGAVAVGMGGIEVALGPAGGAGTPQEEQPEAPPVEEPAAVPEATPAVAEPPPEVAAVEPVEPLEPVEPEPVEEPLPEPEPEPVAVTEPEPPQPKPPVEPPPEAVAVAEPIPEPAPAPVAEPPPEAAPRPAASREAPGPVATTAPDPGSEGTGTQGSRAQGTGSGDDSSGGGMPGAQADYAAILQAWLERHKEYPRRAQRRRQEGTALLYFVMDRDGHVLDYRIEESSGFGLLDREVERMIERAQPLPRMPEEMQQARLELMVPVQFFLR